MVDHEARKQQILNEAKAMGLKGQEAKILSTDPFLVGSETDYINAHWVASLWDRMMNTRRKPMHFRGFHYWVQSQAVKKPDGTIYAQGADPAKDWTFLLHSAQLARYLDIGSWNNIVDFKHPEPSDHDNYIIGSGIDNTGEVDIQSNLNSKLDGLVNEFLRELIYQSPSYQDNGYQLYHNEVWCEKNSMGFIIEPACRKYEACYQALTGQSSVERVEACADRALRAAQAGKKVRIFYISDFDRYGMSMVSAVARKIEFFIQKNPNADVRVTRLALDESQIARFKLPFAPKHGEKVVELDALEAIHPGELGKIVENALKPYYDFEKVKIVQQENRRIKDEVRQMLEEKLRPALTTAFQDIDLEGLSSDIDLTNTINPNFEPPVPEHDTDESKHVWMFDSTRDYWSQWSAYKEYKGSREEEEPE